MAGSHLTLISALREVWQDPSRHEQVAIQDETEFLTYPELLATVSSLAGGLKKAGVQPGDRVALALQRSIQLPLALLATMAVGACPCPLEPKLDAPETARRYRVARIDWTIVNDRCPPGESEYSLDGIAPTRILDLVRLQGAEPFWAEDLGEEAASFLLFTSGSSGPPKGVLQNHRGMLANATGVVAHTGLSADDRLLHVMPLYHTNGIHNQLLAPLLAGATIILADRFRAERMADLVERYQPTILTGVPTIYSRMLSQKFSSKSFASLRMLRCGSAPITTELHRQVEEKFGIPLVISYGLSEATCTSTMNPPTGRRIGSVGTCLQGQDVFLLDAMGKRIPAGNHGEGEICIAGPALMSGYLDEGGHGRPIAVGPYLRTGDLGRFDDDGYLFITGRIKDVIIRGGENLSPGVIEQAICAVPGVSGCCVVGRPDIDLGEVPVAFVVKQRSDESVMVDKEHLHSVMAVKLNRAQRPVDYIFVDALPENSVGKIDRRQLSKKIRDEIVTRPSV